MPPCEVSEVFSPGWLVRPRREKADSADPGQIAAPFSGMVTPLVASGDEIAAGDTVATIEAMKMEAAITSPVAGRVSRIVVTDADHVEGADLIAVIAQG